MEETALAASLPQAPVFTWCLAVDTSGKSPYDIIPSELQQAWRGTTCRLGARSVVVFESRPVTSVP